MHHTRRRFLRSAAMTSAIGVASSAGCLGGGSDADGEDDSNAGGGGYGGGGGGGSSPTDSSGGGMAGPTVAVTEHDTLGDILVDGEGRTLYLFTPDSPGQSVCTGGCAEAWPPLTVENEDAVDAGGGVTADLGTIVRDDGSLQVTADDTPLYYFASDQSPGDAKGQEVNNAWFVLRPDASALKPTVSVREHEEFGPILTDADGMTLYLFANDDGAQTSCTGGCADAWPPLTVGDGGPIESVRTDVTLGTTDHPDVGTMATAAGRPVYYYADDEEPGDANGQGVGDVWFVLDAEGEPIGM